MRILTLFPPLVASCFRGPHLAPPLLTALLNKDHDLRASYLDLNIRAVRTFLFDLFPSVSECILHYRHDSHTTNLLRKVGLLSAEGRIQSQLELIRMYLDLVSHFYLERTNSLQQNIEILSKNRTDSASVAFYQDIIRETLGHDSADVFLISVAFAEQLEAALVFARALKERGAGAVFLGGSQITLLEPDQLELLGALGLFDKICVGYYEAEIASLVKSHAPGGASPVYRANPIDRDAVRNLPRVRFNRDEIRMYLRPLQLPVLATKGCYWGKCTFCDYAKMAAYCQPGYLARDAKMIFLDTVALRMRYPDANISLISDGISPAMYLEICRLAIKSNVKIKTWSYMLHSEQLTDAFFETLSRAGVSYIDFGTESTCDRILALMRKPARRDAIMDNFILAKKHGIATTMNVIIDFPSMLYGECQEVISDIRFLTSYASSINPQFFHLSFNTPICDMSEALQISLNDEYQDTGHGLQCKEFTTDAGMSIAEKKEVVSTIGSICLEQRISHRISRLTMNFGVADSYLCYHDIGAFTFNKEGQWLLNIPSLRLETAIEHDMESLIHRFITSDNPLQCIILEENDGEFYFDEQLLYISAVLFEKICRLGLVAYVKENTSR